MTSDETRKAVFLDRDGVLNADRPDYVKGIDEMRVLPGVGSAVKRLNEAGFLTIITTNQSPIGRGIFTEEHLAEMHRWLCEQLAKDGGAIDDIIYCPHRPDENCECRKPQPGLLNMALAKYALNPDQCFMVGDRESDVRAGKAAGVWTLRIRSTVDPTETEADFQVGDLPEAVSLIMDLATQKEGNRPE